MCSCTYINMFTCINEYLRSHKHVCVGAHIYIYVYIYIHIYAYAYTQAYKHTNTNTLANAFSLCSISEH